MRGTGTSVDASSCMVRNWSPRSYSGNTWYPIGWIRTTRFSLLACPSSFHARSKSSVSFEKPDDVGDTSGDMRRSVAFGRRACSQRSNFTPSASRSRFHIVGMESSAGLVPRGRYETRLAAAPRIRSEHELGFARPEQRSADRARDRVGIEEGMGECALHILEAPLQRMVEEDRAPGGRLVERVHGFAGGLAAAIHVPTVLSALRHRDRRARFGDLP